MFSESIVDRVVVFKLTGCIGPDSASDIPLSQSVAKHLKERRSHFVVDLSSATWITGIVTAEIIKCFALAHDSNGIDAANSSRPLCSWMKLPIRSHRSRAAGAPTSNCLYVGIRSHHSSRIGSFDGSERRLPAGDHEFHTSTLRCQAPRLKRRRA